MGKHLFDDRAVTRIKMPCPRSIGSQESYLSEEWEELSELVEFLKCPHIATVALQKRDLTTSKYLLH